MPPGVWMSKCTLTTSTSALSSPLLPAPCSRAHTVLSSVCKLTTKVDGCVESYLWKQILSCVVLGFRITGLLMYASKVGGSCLFVVWDLLPCQVEMCGCSCLMQNADMGCS